MTEPSDTDDSNALDYKFAWRWLLPLQTDDSLAFFGLDDGAVEWWQQHHGALSPGRPTDGVLLAIDELTQEQIDQSIALHSPRWLCAWGAGKQVDRLAKRLGDYRYVNIYGMLPADMPRLVVPLSSPLGVAAGLRLHRPGRRLVRGAMRLAAFLGRFGSYGLLKRKVLLIACRDHPGVPGAAVRANFSPVTDIKDFALYLGTADSNRKTVALPVPISPSHGIIKYAGTPQACTAIRNEAQALSHMQKTDLSRQVPALLSFKEGETEVTLVQEFRQHRSVSASRQNRAVLQFLRTLTTVDCEESTLGAVLEGVPDKLPKEYGPLLQRLLAMPVDTPVYCHRGHGDFAPWNCSWSKHGLFVYDWEASQACGLALMDAFYYVLAPMLLVQQSTDGRHALHVSMAFASQLIQGSKLNDIDCHFYMALWLLQESSSNALYQNIAVALLEDWL